MAACILSLIMLISSLAAFPVQADSKASRLGSDAKVSSGYYVLRPGCTSTRALMIKGKSKSSGAAAVLYGWQKSAQYFYIKSLGDGSYSIKSYYSGKYLEVRSGSKSSGAVVQQNSWSGLARQKWYIFKKGSRYVIQNSNCKNVLSVLNAANKKNAQVIVHSRSSSSAQLWQLLKVKVSSSSSKKKATPTPVPKKKATPTPTPKPSTGSNLKRTGMKTSDYEILNNVIGAVETGGQVYGKRNYGCYTEPYTNSSLEHTITLGWGGFYGVEAQKLVANILKKDPATFRKIDQANGKKKIVEAKLSMNWVSKRYRPNATEKAIIKQLIVTPAGKKCQDEMFTALMKSYVSKCTSTYTSNTWAVMMYCEIHHLGGQGGADRIFKRCNKNYSMEKILWALKQDQYDSKSSYQVGDAIFWSRHTKCAEFIRKYVK